MLTKKKKIIVLCSMLSLLLVTGFLNFTLNNAADETGGGLTPQNFFASFRADRVEKRNTQLAIWDSIIDSTSASQESKLQAESSKAAILDIMEFERVTEQLILAKGFGDVLVSNSNNIINVIVKSADVITSADVAFIVKVVQDHGKNVDIDNIKVIPVE